MIWYSSRIIKTVHKQCFSPNHPQRVQHLQLEDYAKRMQLSYFQHKITVNVWPLFLRNAFQKTITFLSTMELLPISFVRSGNESFLGRWIGRGGLLVSLHDLQTSHHQTIVSEADSMMIYTKLKLALIQRITNTAGDIKRRHAAIERATGFF